MYGVLHDEAHDAVWRLCAKEQVLAHPHRPSPPLAWHPYYKNVALPRKNGRQAATKNIFASQQAYAIIFGFINFSDGDIRYLIKEVSHTFGQP